MGLCRYWHRRGTETIELSTVETNSLGLATATWEIVSHADILNCIVLIKGIKLVFVRSGTWTFLMMVFAQILRRFPGGPFGGGYSMAKVYCDNCVHKSAFAYCKAAFTKVQVVIPESCYHPEYMDEVWEPKGSNIPAERNANWDCPDYVEIKKVPWWAFWRKD
jgi:hypothetical protein